MSYNLDKKMATIAWKIRSDKDTTLWQLKEPKILVDLINVTTERVLVRPYFHGRHDVDYVDEPAICYEDAFLHLSYMNKEHTRPIS